MVQLSKKNLNTGDLVTRVAVTRRADLTDAQWARLEPLLPRGKKAGRPPKRTKRQLIDGIRWRTRVGSPWRDVPECYGPWQTVYGLFRRWQRAGVWVLIWKTLQAFADAGGRITWRVSADSTIARAHRHAAGARHDGDAQAEPPGGVDTEPADHGLGRSRGGWTTKTHLACEQGRKVLSLLITAGQRADCPQFTAVLEAISVPRLGKGRPRTRPDEALADKAYSSRANRRYLRGRGITATIPIKADQVANRRKKGSAGGRLPAFDPERYKQRHAVYWFGSGRRTAGPYQWHTSSASSTSSRSAPIGRPRRATARPTRYLTEFEWRFSSVAAAL